MRKSEEKVKKVPAWKKVVPFVVLVVLLIGSMAFGVYYYKKYQDLKSKPYSAEEAAKKENERIVKEVAKLYSLPKDEEPTILVVKDKDKLAPEQKQQELFQKAENSDVILIYTKARTAILYRPSTRQLIDVRQVSIQSSKASVVLVGTSSDRSVVETNLASFLDRISVTAKVDAKDVHRETIVVDLSGKNADLAKSIADNLKNARVGTLPTTETKPDNTDIAIFIATTPPPLP